MLKKLLQQGVSEKMIDKEQKTRYEVRAKILKALAHPNRMMMVDALAEGERCVCELRDLVGADTSTVSKHLSVMKNAGIVDYEKRGLQVYYRLKVPCITNFFGCIEAVIAEEAREYGAALS